MSTVGASHPPQSELDELVATATEKWTACGGSEPSGASVLKGPRRKSAVVRLYGAGPRGTNVVAKRCPTEPAERERTVYERVLPQLPVDSLELYAWASDLDGTSWLFIEDAGEFRWSPELAAHRASATDWLAAAHVAAAGLVESIELPSRDTGYFLAAFESARSVLAASLGNDALKGGERILLEELLADFAKLEGAWDEVEELSSRFPRTLTLPGLGRKNSRIRETAGGLTFLPFDFENAGWGVPAVELWQVDLRRYVDETSHAWRVDPAELGRLATIGGGLWSIKSISGEALALTSPWPSPAMEKLAFYATYVSAAVTVVESNRGGGCRG